MASKPYSTGNDLTKARKSNTEDLAPRVEGDKISPRVKSIKRSVLINSRPCQMA